MEESGQIRMNIGKAVFAPKGTLWAAKEIVSESLLLQGVLFYTLCLTTGEHKGVILIEKAETKEGHLIRCEILDAKRMKMEQAASDCIGAAFATARRQNLVDDRVHILLTDQTSVDVEQEIDGTLVLYLFCTRSSF